MAAAGRCSTCVRSVLILADARKGNSKLESKPPDAGSGGWSTAIRISGPTALDRSPPPRACPFRAARSWKAPPPPDEKAAKEVVFPVVLNPVPSLNVPAESKKQSLQGPKL